MAKSSRATEIENDEKKSDSAKLKANSLRFTFFVCRFEVTNYVICIYIFHTYVHDFKFRFIGPSSVHICWKWCSGAWLECVNQYRFTVYCQTLIVRECIVIFFLLLSLTQLTLIIIIHYLISIDRTDCVLSGLLVDLSICKLLFSRLWTGSNTI